MKKPSLQDRPARYNDSATRILHFKFEANQKAFRLHWHNSMEILRIQSGRLYVEYESRTIAVSAGEIIIISPKTLHRGYTLDESAEYDVLMFDVRSFYNETEICKNLLPPIFDGRAIFKSTTADKETVTCFDAIHGEETDLPFRKMWKVYELIALFYQKHLVELRTQPKNASVQKIVDYLEKNFSQEINTPMLCEIFGYSAAHLCRKFKAATGLTPMTYLKIYRLERACKKIRTRESEISEIAAECGFSDANYFTRCFKAHFGVAPSRFGGEY